MRGRETVTGPRWPDLFLVGAPKAGTTSVHALLAAHPDIFMCEPKEPHYFSDASSVPLPVARTPGGIQVRFQDFRTGKTLDERRYLNLFAAAGARRVCGEGSTSYLWDPQAAARVHAAAPHAKVLIMVRDPVKRAYSHFLMRARRSVEDLSFEEVMQKPWADARGKPVQNIYADRSLYAPQVRRFLDLFPKDRVLVLLMEDLKEAPEATLRDLAAFLGVDAAPFAQARPDEARNASRAARGPLSRRLLASPLVARLARAVPHSVRGALEDRFLVREAEPAPLPAETLRRLGKPFVADVRELEGMLGRKLAHRWPSVAPAKGQP